MEPVQFTLLVLNLILVFTSVVGDAMAFFPTEARPINQYQFMHPQFQLASRNAIPPGYVLTHEPGIPQEGMVPQENIQPIFHTAEPQREPGRQMEGHNYTFLGTPRVSEEDHFRAAKSGYEYPAHAPASYPQAPPYGYNTPPAPNYSPPAAAPASPTYSPPAPAHHTSTSKFSLLKPDLTSLIKPVSTKVAGKISGLIDLVLTLLTGTASDDFEMKGFKDIVINGIVKPLLIAKGGIKSLISKLTIPLISLLLINLEVLITVWWLWEECPESKPSYEYSKPAYTSPPSNYNSYS